MFIGEFSCKVDNKGRVMMPIKFREQLGSEEFVITRGLDNCINLFPIERWSEVEARLKELKMTNSKHRAYQRFILSAATKLSLDNQGRLSIPASLMKYSEIEKNNTILDNVIFFVLIIKLCSYFFDVVFVFCRNVSIYKVVLIVKTIIYRIFIVD